MQQGHSSTGHGLGDNKKGILAQQAGGEKNNHCPSRTGLRTDQDPVGGEELRCPPDLEQWDHRQLPVGMWE